MSYIVIYSIINDTINKQTQEDFFNKIYVLLTLFVTFERVTQGLRVRGSWRPNRTAIFWPQLLWPSTLCLSRSPDDQPEAQRPTLLGDGFLYCILSASSLDPNSSEPQAPSAWCGFPYHISSITPPDLQLELQLLRGPKAPSAWYGFTYHSSSSTLSNSSATPLTSVLTELYNSSTATQSPTRSLKSHVWSSSSGNNCHAVHSQ